MVEESFNNEVITLGSNMVFSLMHLNARSLMGNFDKFKILLANMKKTFSLIGVSETWLNDLTSDLVNMSGYSFVSNHQKSKTGGGVGLYLKNNLDYKLLSECNFSDPDLIESLFVEINVPKGKIIVTGIIYQPPNQNTAVQDEPLNEYQILYLAAMTFPTLFPDGRGDPTNKALVRDISLAERVKHLIKFAEKLDNRWIYRFASHPRFSY